MASTSGSSSTVNNVSNKILPSQQQQQQQWRPPPQEAALPLHVQSLERALDVNGFINQLEKLLTTSLETASSAVFAECGLPVGETSQVQKANKKSMLTTKGIWDDDQVRKRDLSYLYNFSTLGKRKWLKNVLLEDSDSDSDTEQVITERDLKILLKIHKYRRKYQKRYHTDILNSQYTYFGAGLLSEHDRFPEHQKFILGEYGFTIPAPPPAFPPLTPAVAPVSPPKRSPIKRRRNSQRSTLSIEAQNKSTVSSTTSSVGNEMHLTGQGGQQSTHPPSASSDFNSPMSSPSPYPFFAVPLTKLPSTSTVSTTLIDNRASVSKTIGALVRPLTEPSGGDSSSDALRWRAWKAIAVEDIPKAYTERIIQRKYHSVVLKQIALYCSQFLEQARELAMSGKHKPGGRHGKKQGGQIIGLRPVNKQQPQPPPPSTQASTSK